MTDPTPRRQLEQQVPPDRQPGRVRYGIWPLGPVGRPRWLTHGWGAASTLFGASLLAVFLTWPNPNTLGWLTAAAAVGVVLLLATLRVSPSGHGGQGEAGPDAPPPARVLRLREYTPGVLSRGTPGTTPRSGPSRLVGPGQLFIRTAAGASLVGEVEREVPLSAEETPVADLQTGDVVLIEAGQTIPDDGGVLEGAALVDESAVTGQSSPVLREADGDRAAVLGQTRLLTGRLIVRLGDRGPSQPTDRREGGQP
jgi:hypothetical protein